MRTVHEATADLSVEAEEPHCGALCLSVLPPVEDTFQPNKPDRRVNQLAIGSTNMCDQLPAKRSELERRAASTKSMDGAYRAPVRSEKARGIIRAGILRTAPSI